MKFAEFRRSEHAGDPEEETWIVNNLAYGSTYFSVTHAPGGGWEEISTATSEVFTVINSNT